jgi:hypothetical protein
MRTQTDRHVTRTSNCLALCLAMAFASAQPALALVVSFEQSEGFPAPVLIPPPETHDQNPNTFTGFAGGPNTYGQPLMPTNGGAIVNWGLESPADTHGTWFIDDGPGGLDIQAGAVATCTGPSVDVCWPAPHSGAAMAGFYLGTLGGEGFAYEGVMDLDNSQNIQLESFYFASRGYLPPRLQVEYYANDANETFLGVNTYALGTDPTDHTPGLGDRFVGMGRESSEGTDYDYVPKFQLITPTAPFQGVALGKVVFRSFADGVNGQNTGQPTDEANGDVPHPNGHGAFFLDDITLQANGTPYNPNNYTHLSFEASEGFPDGDGASMESTAVLNVVTGFEVSGNSVLNVDHGPGGEGNLRPGSEPDPIHGSQIALSATGTGTGANEVTIDLHNPGNYGLAGFWYAYRGTDPPKLTVEYYDSNDNLVGENVYKRGTDVYNVETSGTYDQYVGMGPDGEPKFQFIEPSAPFQNVALSKIKIISAPPNPATGHGMFAMDDVLLKPNSGTFNPGNKVRVSFEVSEGFSGTDGAVIAEFEDGTVTAVPGGIVDDWVLSGAGAAYFQIDKGPGGQGFGDEDDPVSGNQFGLSTPQGNGPHVLTMDLNNSANLALESFYFASRGNFPPNLTVEYFDLNNQSLGTDVYTAGVGDGQAVGLGPNQEPRFQLLEPSAQFLDVALSKLVFTSQHDNPANLTASFAIDDILFHVVTAGVDGDYNDDGTVDAADYVVWRKNQGTTTPLPNDPHGGTIGTLQYDTWRANFGSMAGSGSGSGAGPSGAPEPACWIMALFAAECVAVRARCGRRRF